MPTVALLAAPTLGADPELKMTQGGQAVLKLRLATTETYLDKNQTRQERTEWHSVTLWGKRGEALAKFLTKGERIFVEGSLRTSSYEKNGEKRYSTEINVRELIMLGGGRAGGGGDFDGAESSPRRAPAAAPKAKATAGGEDFEDFPNALADEDDDLPF
jgi:single-strand DNA-binding protein